MTTKTKAKAITFTPKMIGAGIAAIRDGMTAEQSKLVFFKAIKRRVSVDQLPHARQAFVNLAVCYYDNAHDLEGALINELAKPKLKESSKLGRLTIRQHKDNVRNMARRWLKSYKGFLTTGEANQSRAKKKRATGGEVSGSNQVSADGNQVNLTVVKEDDIDTQYQRDILIAYPRAAFYKATQERSQNEETMLKAWQKIIDNASASCQKAAGTLIKMESSK